MLLNITLNKVMTRMKMRKKKKITTNLISLSRDTHLNGKFNSKSLLANTESNKILRDNKLNSDASKRKNKRNIKKLTCSTNLSKCTILITLIRRLQLSLMPHKLTLFPALQEMEELKLRSRTRAL